jgi:hypothetical protein
MNEYKNLTQARRLTGLSYLGSISETVKHKKSIKYGELTYSLYLAPGKTSGYEVCPGRTAECSKFCLNESGMNTMTQNIKGDVINNSRITKTRLFFEDREFFMHMMIAEIRSGITRAAKLGYTFSVRLNNTSDINPKDFQLDGKNILEIFPQVTFYDYSKVANRVDLMKQYSNYDLTYSYTGHNLTQCEEMLLNKINVAVVFKFVPNTFMGYPVVDGDKNDLRYKDLKGVVVGLLYKRTRQRLTPDIKFVVQ